MDILKLKQAKEQIENDMSLPSKFLDSLLKEDDWSFVIKSHAFLEALLTHVLVESSHRHEAQELFAHLDMGDHRGGKIKFAAAFGLIKKDGERFLNEFSKLRNRLVHGVNNISFSFRAYISALDENQKKSFIRAWSYFASDEDLKDRYEVVRDLILNDTKNAIWLSLLHFAGLIYWAKEVKKAQLVSRVLSEEIQRIKSKHPANNR